MTAGGTVTLDGHPFLVDAVFIDGGLDEAALVSWSDYTRAFGPGEDATACSPRRS